MSDAARPVGIFLGTGPGGSDGGFSPPSVFLPAANQWFPVSVDIPWPASFNRSDVTSLSLFVDKLRNADGSPAPDGSVRFDDISFSCVPLEPAVIGTAAVVDDFDDLHPGLNRRGGGSAAFASGTAVAASAFLPPAGSNFARSITVPSNAEFGGFYSVLHGRADYPEFTFDASAYEYVRCKVRSGSGAPFTAALKVEVKGAGANDLERYERTAFRILQVPLSPDAFTTITLPLNVADRSAWTHNRYAPDKAALKEVVVLAEKHFNTLPLTFVLDDIEFVDIDGPAPPAATAPDSVLLPYFLRENLTYFLREVHPVTGLVLDRESFSDLAGVAATGFGLSAWPIAAQEGLISRAAAYGLAVRALTTLERPDKMSWTRDGPPPRSGITGVDGFFYRYFDSRTGLRKIPEPPSEPADASPADTALLVWGALSCKGSMTAANGYTAAQQAEITRLTDSIVNRIEWSRWLVTQDGISRMILGFKPESDPGYRHLFLGGYASGRPGRAAAWDYHTDEILLIALAGMSAPDAAKRLPASFLKSWIRYRASYGGHSAVQSFFGSAFAHQFAGLWLPLHTFSPDPTGLDIYENNRQAHLANRAFCRSTFWNGRQSTFDGISAFLTAHEDIDGRYAGHGAPPCGLCYFCGGADADYLNCGIIPRFEDFPANTKPAPDMVNGSLSPYGAGAAFYYLPADAAAVLRHYYTLGLWNHGRGFPDALHLSVPQFLAQESEYHASAPAGSERLAQWQRLSRINGRIVQPIQFGIDQGPLVISLANHLRGGLVQNWTMQNSRVVTAAQAAFPAGVAPAEFAAGLQVQQCGSEWILSWPQHAAGARYILEESPGLSEWTPVPGAGALSERWYKVIPDFARPSHYYRVRVLPP